MLKCATAWGWIKVPTHSESHSMTLELEPWLPQGSAFRADGEPSDVREVATFEAFVPQLLKVMPRLRRDSARETSHNYRGFLR